MIHCLRHIPSGPQRKLYILGWGSGGGKCGRLDLLDSQLLTGKRMSARPRVAVVGAGVIGLSTAVCLAETYGRQLDITVIAEHFSPDTTSDRAGATIKPFIPPSTSGASSEHSALLARWSTATFDRCRQLYESPERLNSGVHLIPGYKMYPHIEPPPWWSNLVQDFRVLTREEASEADLPVDDYGTFWSYTTYFIRGKFHLPWLLKRFRDSGGLVEQRRVGSLSELQGYDVIVNCTGLGARELVGDESVYPYRGQIVVLRNSIGLRHFYEGLEVPGICTHVFPFEDVIIIGGILDTHNYSTTVDPDTNEDIFKRNTALVPAIKDAQVVDTYTCLRPYCPTVRLEAESADGRSGSVVVHCYGHGGQGWTLHWGCALDVAALVGRELTTKGLLLGEAKL